MTFQATTRIKLGQGPGVDDYGDPTEGGAPAEDARDYRASIIEKTKAVLDPTSGEMRTVRYAIGRVDPGCPVDDQSVIYTREGVIYVVDEVTRNPRTISGAADVRLDLRITSGE